MNEIPLERMSPDEFLHQIDVVLRHLSEEQLHLLHTKLAERLRVIQGHRQSHGLLRFRVGDRVSFVDHRTHIRLYGTVIRLNQKTATVAVEGGQQWRIPPSFLTKAE